MLWHRKMYFGAKGLSLDSLHLVSSRPIIGLYKPIGKGPVHRRCTSNLQVKVDFFIKWLGVEHLVHLKRDMQLSTAICDMKPLSHLECSLETN